MVNTFALTPRSIRSLINEHSQRTKTNTTRLMRAKGEWLRAGAAGCDLTRAPGVTNRFGDEWWLGVPRGPQVGMWMQPVRCCAGRIVLCSRHQNSAQMITTTAIVGDEETILLVAVPNAPSGSLAFPLLHIGRGPLPYLHCCWHCVSSTPL